MKNKFKIAFIGNPNVGKSSLINAYSKKNQLQIGNWSGVTVEKLEVSLKHEDSDFLLTDLPGIFDFYESSLDEKVTINNILSHQYDLFVNVVDATNLKQSLHLTLLLRELNLPMVIVLNFSDKINKFAQTIDIQKLSKILKYPVTYASALKKLNIQESLSLILKEASNNNHVITNRFLYSQELNDLKETISIFLEKNNFHVLMGANEQGPLISYGAIRLIENDTHYFQHLKLENLNIHSIKKEIETFGYENSQTPQDVLKIKRANFLNNLLLSVYQTPISDRRLNITKKVDRVLANRFVGIPIMLIIFGVSFILVFNLSTPMKNFIDTFINSFLAGLIANTHMPGWLINLINNGIFAGVGTIVTFTPVIFCLFIWMNILRESGYLNRVVFLLTHVFRKCGLSGKSLVPLILGFGCNITSVYATRTIHSPKRRKITALVSPMMSCNARVAIYGLFATAFFIKAIPLVMISMYFIGIIVALIIGSILNLFIKGEGDLEDQLVELHPYQWPNMGIVFRSALANAKSYLKKASTIILIFSIFLWLFTYFPDPNNPANSIIAHISRFISPIFAPIGIHNWELIAAIFPAIMAKEMAVGAIAIFLGTTSGDDFVNFHELLRQFGQMFVLMGEGLLPNNWASNFMYSPDSHATNVTSRLQSLSNFNSFNAYVYMVFMALTIPCITTIAAIRQEFGAKTALFSVSINLITPYILCLIIYQLGRLIH